jgi:hypothetical protein
MMVFCPHLSIIYDNNGNEAPDMLKLYTLNIPRRYAMLTQEMVPTLRKRRTIGRKTIDLPRVQKKVML